MKKSLYFLGILVLLLITLSMSVSAEIVWNDDTPSNDGYYHVVSKADWEIAPGIWEAEIVLNNATNSYRQVVHLMEIDTANPATQITAGYAEMNPEKKQTATVSKQVRWVEQHWGWDVVGAMNKGLKDKLNAMENPATWPFLVFADARSMMKEVARNKLRTFGSTGRL